MADSPPPPIRTGPALLKPVTWCPEPLDVVLVLGFLLLVGGIALLTVPGALITAGILMMVAWARIALRVDEAKRPTVER